MSRLIRILHVVGGLNKGGVETWLVQLLREIDREQFHIDVLVHTSDKCAYDDEVKALGSSIIPCLSPNKPWLYAKNFKHIMQHYGPYDVVHSHVHRFSGFVVFLANSAGVPMRIVHSRNSDDGASTGFLRNRYDDLMNYFIKRYTTHRFAVAKAAAIGLFGEEVVLRGQYNIVRSSIDLTSFEMPVDQGSVRSSLGLPAEAKVVGHIGRFAPQKNHAFLIDVADEVLQRQPDVVVLLVGEGPLQPQIEKMAADRGIADRIIFAGAQSDIPRLLRGAVDVFVLPSKWEGMARVFVEAQAAGVPCVVSEAVPEEADLVHPLVTRLSLSQVASTWARAITASLASDPAVLQTDALSIIKHSPFNITVGTRDIERYYRGEVGG